MSDKTGIEWTDATWNPVWGCTPVSPGCDHCYAETLVNGRLAHLHPGGFGVVRLRPEQLDKPMRWRRPRRVFVNSMSDLFHDAIPDDYIARVFAVMGTCADHIFQLLTKRHGRMRSLLSSEDFRDQVAEHHLHYFKLAPSRTQTWPGTWPLPNVWLGVSVEDQRWAQIRIPALLDTPAAVRFLSCEPLLGPLNLEQLGLCNAPWNYTEFGVECFCRAGAIVGPNDRCTRSLDWVIAGGESGRGARQMDLDWIRSLRDQCDEAGVPFFYKQQGSGDGGPKSRRELDGRTWDEFPEAVTVHA